MRIVRYRPGRRSLVGALLDDVIVDLTPLISPESESGEQQHAEADLTVRFIRGGPGLLKRAVETIGAIRDRLPRDRAALIADGTISIAADANLAAPVPRPEKLICAWVNYPHARTPRFEQPIFFSKFPSAIIGPGDAILLPDGATQTIVEAELAVVIGKDGKNIDKSAAFDHIFGYTIVNDLTALNWRLEAVLGVMGPYMMGKSIDTFAPMGPCIATRDEVPDPHHLATRYWVNGEHVLEGTTSGMLFDIPTLISYLSRFFALRCGDVIATGSPTNTDPSRKPRPYLAPGDHVRIEIERLGTLENPVGRAG